MKTMIFATAAVFALGVGSAFVGEFAGAPPRLAPRAVAANQHAAPATILVAGRSGTTSLFPPHDGGGSNS